MNEQQINEQQQYKCKSTLLSAPFIGRVCKKYQHTCIVEGQRYALKDRQTGFEYQDRFVVRYEEMVELSSEKGKGN